ncbi:MAG TPA: DNA polymerase I, partial [Burkholderiaceae bacterium]
MPIAHGTHAYAERVGVMLFAWALDDAPAQVWYVSAGPAPAELVAALADTDTQVWAHNSAFDRTVLRHALPAMCPPLEQWRDTMVQALAHSLPASLGALCDALGLPADKAKDKEGKQLVQLFCKPRPKGSTLRRATRDTHPAQWKAFVDYARLDVEAMRECHRRMPKWNYPNNANELALWHLDQRINDRGFAVDLDLARAAVDAVAAERERLADAANDMTLGAVQSATQRDAVLRYALAAFDVALPDLQQATLERRIADPDLPPALRDLLALRLEASGTAVTKYATLLRSASPDARLRGTLQFDGASRTGRWAGRIFQPQNLPRPSLKNPEIDGGIGALKA